MSRSCFLASVVVLLAGVMLGTHELSSSIILSLLFAVSCGCGCGRAVMVSFDTALLTLFEDLQQSSSSSSLMGVVAINVGGLVLIINLSISRDKLSAQAEDMIRGWDGCCCSACCLDKLLLMGLFDVDVDLSLISMAVALSEFSSDSAVRSKSESTSL